MPPLQEPTTEFYCPVCGRDLRFIYVWRQPDSERIRVFCEDCAHRDEYRTLPKPELTILNAEGFQRFVTQRFLREVWRKERAQDGSGG